jgi:hypothetical protein
MKCDAPSRIPVESSSRRPSTVKVLIAYEDYRVGRWSKQLFDRLQCRLESDQFLSVLFWKFDVLRFPQLKALAVDDAAEADLIVFAGYNNADLPAFVKSWIGQWAPRKDRGSGSLVALLGDPAGPTSKQGDIESFLQHAACCSGLDFIVCHTEIAQFKFNPALDDVAAAVQKVIPSADEAFRPIAWAAGSPRFRSPAP